VRAVNDQGDAKKLEDPGEEDEDPYAGYEEQQGNTRAGDLYLDTVSHSFNALTLTCLWFVQLGIFNQLAP
jgi:hypothetical protein